MCRIPVLGLLVTNLGKAVKVQICRIHFSSNSILSEPLWKQ